MKNRLSILVFCAVVICGCFRYKAQDLDDLNVRQPDAYLTKEKVTVSVYVLDHEESVSCFGDDLLKRGILPVRLSIRNDSGQHYLFLEDGTDLPSIDPLTVATAVRNDKGFYGKYTSTSLMLTGGTLVGGALALYPMVKEDRETRELYQDYAKKAMGTRMIRNGRESSGVIFVLSEACMENFRVKLEGKANGRPLEFDFHIFKTGEEVSGR